MKRTALALILLLSLTTGSVLVRAENEAGPTLSDVGTYSSDARAARIATLRDTYKIKLDDKEKVLVISRCVGAQEGLKKISTKLVVVRTTREKSYSTVISTLIQLQSLIATKGVDTSGIDLLVVSYQQKKAGFDASLANYELTLEDATSIDCRATPEDFRAALEGVRAARKPVVEVSSQISEITRSNLKTTFDAVRLKLQTGASTSGQ